MSLGLSPPVYQRPNRRSAHSCTLLLLQLLTRGRGLVLELRGRRAGNTDTASWTARLCPHTRPSSRRQSEDVAATSSSQIALKFETISSPSFQLCHKVLGLNPNLLPQY
ncbi:hypothetical protein B0H16DRAFT_512055 [Mycena metata]|uniref:Uncharacterized protein n=1 Tax=Mycena metata TaxID=1033252 RepID=A0AAD7H916_9AGAR|nr:hypothetical protein B0H16DRAFT_512055 [Mycena metata]